MAEDWLADVRKYVADADENVVKAIVRYCGIALQKLDSSLVSFSDKKETDRVRENYLKKKLGRTESDDVLDAAIAAVGERMKEDRTKNRVTVYYLLAEHFGALGIFGGTAAAAAKAAPLAAAGIAAAGAAASAAGGAASRAVSGAADLASDAVSGATAAVAGAAGAVAAAASKAGAEPVRAAAIPEAAASRPAGQGRRLGPDEGIFGWGCGVAALVIGAIILAALLAWLFMRPSATTAPAAPAPAPAPVEAPAMPEPAAAPAPVEIPTGSGIIAGERNGKPMLTVYFDTAKSDLPADFAKVAKVITDYVAQNPSAKLAISGFNDPRGNAAANAELSKNRAQSVQKGLEGLGVPATAMELVKPESATDTTTDLANARRVEVTVQ